MRDIDKALTLYSMMARRCEQSGLAPKQAQIYREMIEFMRDCETAAAASVKIKNSKYFLAPGAALVQDKLAALEKASHENGMPDVAEVYRKKIDEIETDTGAMYESGYEVTAQNLKRPYLETYEAFSDIYGCYQILSCCNAIDDTTIRSAVDDLRKSLGRLSKPSSNFTELAAEPRFRDLIPATDEGYAHFVRAVPALAAYGADFDTEKRQIQEEYDKTQQFLANGKEPVITAGKTSTAKVMRSQVIALAPDSKEGSYVYADEEVMRYE